MSVFDIAEFGRRHDGEVVGLAKPGMFECPFYALRLLDLPVKLPYGPYLVPEFAETFRPLIEAVEAYVDAAPYYAYLTVDQGLVKVGTAQRSTGCHVDGFQGTRIDPKVETDISFVASNVLPTVFYRQTWPLEGIDVATTNVFHVLDRLAREETAWRPQPYEIVKCSAYTVHRADVATRDVVRTFLRLTYSVREFDRLGNSVNPIYGALWPYVSRETPKGLA